MPSVRGRTETRLPSCPPVWLACCIAAPCSVGLLARRTSKFTRKITSREQDLDALPSSLAGPPMAHGAIHSSRISAAALPPGGAASHGGTLGFGRSSSRRGPVHLTGDLRAPSGGPPGSRPRHCRPDSSRSRFQKFRLVPSFSVMRPNLVPCGLREPSLNIDDRGFQSSPIPVRSHTPVNG